MYEVLSKNNSTNIEYMTLEHEAVNIKITAESYQ